MIEDVVFPEYWPLFGFRIWLAQKAFNRNVGGWGGYRRLVGGGEGVRKSPCAL